MTDLELKIVANAKPRVKEYEPRLNAKSFDAGTVKVPIISFDGAFDSLIYSPAQKKIVAIEYPVHKGKKKIEHRRIDVSGINWDKIPDPPEMLATWNLE